MKLVLQLASDYIGAFETIIAAYSRIADVFPRFDWPSATVMENHDVQQVLAVIYADILAFHEWTYQLVRRQGGSI